MVQKKRKTSRRKSANRGRSRRKTAASPRVPWRGLLALTVLLTLLVGGYSLYLAKIVRVGFEGTRWAVPARIYARPLELYVGARVTAAQLAQELQFLGYRKVGQVFAGAQWSRQGNRFVVHSRPFAFWDGVEPSRHVVIDLDDGLVMRLRRAAGGDVDLMRLEPGVIGSIYPAHSEDRVLVRRDQLPGSLVDGLLAVEDRRFFDHAGVDWRGIARAAWANLLAGKVVQGGSTLTQQLVKNFFLTPERSMWRKLNEALMAVIVDARYDKDEILEAYANEVFLGQEGARAIHGFGLAAQFYFGRPLQELQLHETALLVGLVKGASFYNPRRHPQRALQRRNLVIESMQAANMITPAAADSARQKDLGVTTVGARQAHRVPAFVDLVRRQLRRDYRDEDLTSEGLRIFTAFDPWVQAQAHQALAGRLQSIESARGIKTGSLEGAVVVTSVQDGEVQALVGGRAATFAGFNRALDAVRPIGSLVKPAVYLAALAQPQRYTLTTRIDDAEVDMRLPGGQRWQPRNYDREVHGPVPLHLALARSLNLATVNLGLAVGLDEVIDTLRALGVVRDIRPLPSLLLGALSLSPLEVTQVYQSLAAGGFHSPLRAIRAVLDADGQPLQRYPLTVTQSADPSAVFLLNRNLVEVTRQGTGAGLRALLGDELQVAGKTGTTNDLRDSWFAGFSGDRVATVWVGRDDNGTMGLTGSQGALPVWGELMRSIDTTPLQLSPPAGIEYHWVDSNGRLAAEDCVEAQAFPYVAGSQPSMPSSCIEQQSSGGFWRGWFD